MLAVQAHAAEVFIHWEVLSEDTCMHIQPGPVHTDGFTGRLSWNELIPTILQYLIPVSLIQSNRWLAASWVLTIALTQP